MKRSLEMELEQILPNELIVEIILESFSRRIKTHQDWHRLHQLFTNLIELRRWKKAEIYAKINYICPQVMSTRHFFVLGQFKFLEKISLYHPLEKETRSWYEILSSLPSVKNVKCGDISLETQFSMAHRLEKLSIFILNDYHELEKLTSLKRLHLSRYRNMSGRAFPPLTNLTSLRIGDCWNCREIFKNLTNLRSLFLESWTGPIYLDDSLKNLTALSTSQCIVDIHALRLENLRILKMDRSTVYLDWERMGNLTKLGVYYVDRMTDDCLEHLTNLTSLALIGARANTKLQLVMTSLTELNIGHSFLRPCHRKFPNLKSLHLTDNKMTFNHDLKEMTNLTHLDLRENTRLSEDCLQNLYQLRRLDLSPRSLITEECLSRLTNLRHLTTEERHAFFIPNLFIERHPLEYYRKRSEKLKFFLDD